MPKRALYQISLKLIIKNDRDEVLILKADNIGSYAGYYDLPGGRIDKNEVTLPLGDIIKREILEEIGNIEITTDLRPVAIGRHFIPQAMTSENMDLDIMYIFFEAHYRGGDVVISKEHVEYKWVKLNKISIEQYFKSGILEGVKMYLSK